MSSCRATNANRTALSANSARALDALRAKLREVL